MKKALIAACLAGSVAAPAAAQTTTFNWGGFAKLDVIYSSFSDGAIAQSTSRDFYVPGTIPVSDGTGTGLRRNYLDMHAKETRLFLSTQTDVGTAHKLGGHVEFDFISGQVPPASGGGNEAVTNAYNPALRRAFITYDKWLFGQDWSTFTNLGAIPETLDFVAFASDGTTFARQPMIRYTHGP
ncbi:MAG: porin, partial [Gammaproteobacteria bacterium]